MKRNILIFLLVTAVVVSACAQQSLSGRYITDDEDCIYQYFEFTANGRVRVGLEFLGYTQTLSGQYEIDGRSVYVTVSGDTVELEIEDSNTLVGDGIGMYDVVFTKAGSTPRR